jgi:hypothetical protein
MSAKISQSAPRFECLICCDDFEYPKSAHRTRHTVSECKCPRCEYTVCSTCQTRFGRAECSSCHFEFTRSFMVTSLGETFLKNVAIPNITKELMLSQRANLGTTDVQATLNWINECNEIRKNTRFGGTTRQPGRPKLDGGTIAHRHSCTIGSCRGIALLKGENVSKCNTCSGVMCCRCQCEIKKGEVHVCDPHDLEVLRKSNPCPKCMSLIQHDGGCDDMVCTSCGTKFNWTTGVIMNHTSNTHYNEALYGLNTSLGCVASHDYPRIALDVIMECAQETSDKVGINFNAYPPRLIDCLYGTTDVIREYAKRTFNSQVATTSWVNKTHDLRIKYLTNEISETKWAKQVYSLWTRYRYQVLHSGIIDTFLVKTDDFQLHLRDALIKNADTSVYESILKEYGELVDICNSCFVNIFDTYPVILSPMHICTLEESSTLECPVFGELIVVAEEPKSTAKAKKAKKEKDESDTEINAKEIQLMGYQVSHTERLDAILDTCHFALDLSMLGAGKTYTAMEIYKRRGYNRGLIIAPASMVDKWSELTTEYGLSGITVVSFNALGGTKTGTNRSIRHLIRRGDIFGEGVETETNHKATSQLVQYVKEGMMVIIDEIQCIKNKGIAKTSACKEIIRVILDEYKKTQGVTKSRTLLISGSPIDNYTQVEQFFKTIGVMKSIQFERFNIGAYSRARRYGDQTGMDEAGNIETGLAEIHDFCVKYDRDSAFDVKQSYYSLSVCGQKSTPILKCYDYFMTIVKLYLSSSMTVSGNNCRVSKYNGMYPLKYGTKDNYCLEIKNLMEQGEDKVLQGLRKTSMDDGVPMDSLQSLQLIQRGLNMIETSKIPLFVKIVRDALSKNPSCKVVVAFNYTLSISDLERELSDFGVIILDGSVSAKKRQTLLREFQEPNLNVRVLVGNTKVISTGIDLDDKDGAFPRVCFVSPSYHTIDLYQLSYRFLRSTATQSDSQMYLVYTATGEEQHLIHSLTKKGGIMKMVTQEQSDLAGITFPCDYETFHPEPPQDETKWNRDCDEIFNRNKHGSKV